MIRFSRSRLPEAPVADPSNCHPPEPPATEEPAFWRELLHDTLAYMKWGYGGVGVSIIAYVAYAALKKI
jgi:hypothetical protein